MLWKDALYDYQMYLKLEKRVSANTIEGYLRDIQKLINYSDKQPFDFFARNSKNWDETS